jgi:hypothetical protein
MDGDAGRREMLAIAADREDGLAFGVFGDEGDAVGGEALI